MDVDLAKQCLEDKKAVTLDANQIKKTISGSKVQKRKNVVQVLDSPFVYDWSHLSAEQEQELLSSLLKMTCPVRAESKGKSKTSREDDTSTQNDLGNIKEITTTARKHFAIGLRDVTKAVASSEVLAVFCEKTADPPLLTKLLIPICQVKDIPLVPIKHFSSTVSKSLNVLRCLALALKKPVADAESPFQKSYSEIRDILNVKTTKPSSGCPTELLPSSSGVITEIPATKPTFAVKKRRSVESSPEETQIGEKYYLKKSKLTLQFIPNKTRNPLLTSSNAQSNVAKVEDINFITLGTKSGEQFRSPVALTLRRPKLKKIEKDETKTKNKKNRRQT